MKFISVKLNQPNDTMSSFENVLIFELFDSATFI